MRIPEYPPILTGNTQQDSYNLREYIIRNIEMLQQELLDAGGSIYVENGDVYVSIGGNTMTLQEFIEKNINVDGDTINITVNATIETKADLQEKSVNVTENGDFTVSPDEGKDGLSKVNLHVAVPEGAAYGTVNITENGTYDVTDYASAEVDVQPDLQSKSVTITENGSQTVTPSAGKDGLSSVAITVNVPTTVQTQTKSVTPSRSQQAVTPDEGKYLTRVTVEAAPLDTEIGVTPGTSDIVLNPSGSNIGLSKVTVFGDTNLKPGNIRNGITIFDVAGTYSPSFNLQTKNVTPSGSAQTIMPDSGYDALGQVNVAAIALEAKSVTPSASQQVITPASGYSGLSKVTVAGDADLIASNIKKDVNIFGVIGTYEGSVPITGSLIEVTCSSNISLVTATVNGKTYTARLNTSTHKAYVTIPYTDTTQAANCSLVGAINGGGTTTTTVPMAAGIGYYTATLSTSSILWQNGNWVDVDNPGWDRSSMGGGAIQVTYPTASTMKILLNQPTYYSKQGTIALTPKISNRGYSQLRITITDMQDNGTYGGCKAETKVNNGATHSSTNLTTGTNILELPSIEFNLAFEFTTYGTLAAPYITISKIEFV